MSCSAIWREQSLSCKKHFLSIQTSTTKQNIVQIFHMVGCSTYFLNMNDIWTHELLSFLADLGAVSYQLGFLTSTTRRSNSSPYTQVFGFRDLVNEHMIQSCLYHRPMAKFVIGCQLLMSDLNTTMNDEHDLKKLMDFTNSSDMTSCAWKLIEQCATRDDIPAAKFIFHMIQHQHAGSEPHVVENPVIVSHGLWRMVMDITIFKSDTRHVKLFYLFEYFHRHVAGNKFIALLIAELLLQHILRVQLVQHTSGDVTRLKLTVTMILCLLLDIIMVHRLTNNEKILASLHRMISVERVSNFLQLKGVEQSLIGLTLLEMAMLNSTSSSPSPNYTILDSMVDTAIGGCISLGCAPKSVHSSRRFLERAAIIAQHPLAIRIMQWLSVNGMGNDMSALHTLTRGQYDRLSHISDVELFLSTGLLSSERDLMPSLNTNLLDTGVRRHKYALWETHSLFVRNVEQFILRMQAGTPSSEMLPFHQIMFDLAADVDKYPFEMRQHSNTRSKL